MSWISDVKTEIQNLDVSRKSLRKFAFLVGGVLLLISIWFFIREKFPQARIILTSLGAVLVVLGTLIPDRLAGIYKIWMGLAFAIGWVVSRILLGILFFLVVTPAALLARAIGKKFLDIDFKEKKESYWIKRPPEKQINYEKMY